MPFADLSHEDLRKALSELDQALFHHDQWYEELIRTLVCGLSPDERDVVEDAHHNCRFGQWLHGAAAHRLASHPALAEIDGSVFLNGDTDLSPGEVVTVRITHADDYDLWGVR